jgi:hypothetical protein
LSRMSGSSSFDSGSSVATSPMFTEGIASPCE